MSTNENNHLILYIYIYIYIYISNIKCVEYKYNLMFKIKYKISNYHFKNMMITLKHVIAVIDM